uniref:Uncharacterized protein n=1 Tax=Brassica oleracea var. oleracea TaxID=109376 RepID=A0A0D3BH46_BRAOL
MAKGFRDVWTCDATGDGRVASYVFMLELNFHSGSSIYSIQWFACLASHTSRSNSPVAHPSFFPCSVAWCFLGCCGVPMNDLEGRLVAIFELDKQTSLTVLVVISDQLCLDAWEQQGVKLQAHILSPQLVPTQSRRRSTLEGRRSMFCSSVYS